MSRKKETNSISGVIGEQLKNRMGKVKCSCRIIGKLMIPAMSTASVCNIINGGQPCWDDRFFQIEKIIREYEKIDAYAKKRNKAIREAI